MYKIGICEDELIFQNKLSEICNSYFHRLNKECTITTYQNGMQLLREQESFDFLFLDIHMPEIDGIRVARSVRTYDKNVKIIYITSFPDYKSHAFSVHAFGYITKPFVPERIEAMLTDAISHPDTAAASATFLIRKKDETVSIDVADILYLECRSHTATLHTRMKNYEFTSNMKNILETLEKSGFTDCHRNYIVNMASIRRIDNYDIELENGATLPLAPRKSDTFFRTYSRYLKKHAKKQV